ncbi:MAG TPA: hypothetical protein VK988_13040 [Acidimicrobiales bacterium]|nr:hypothetical protein [Acidimicrobiales bacterium]
MAVAVEGHGDRGVTHALLQCLGVRTLADGQRHCGVAQVVESQPVEANSPHRWRPNSSSEVRAPHRLAQRRGEHQPAADHLGPGELDLEHLRQGTGDRDGPATSGGLGRPPRQLAGQLVELFDDDDGSPQEVHPRHPQPGQLAPPQPGVGGGVDQVGGLRSGGLGQCGHLVGGEEAHLPPRLGREPEPFTRGAGDQASFDCAPHDLGENLAHLANRRRRVGPGGKHVGDEAAHHRMGEARQRDRSEAREQVDPDDPEVSVERRGPQVDDAL